MLRQFIEDNFEFGTLDGRRVFIFGDVMADFDFFLTHFGTVDVVTVASLKARDPENVMGWHRHFDEWAAQHILPE